MWPACSAACRSFPIAPWSPRPLWGKLFTQTRAVSEAYPRFDAFRDLRERYDPERKFVNALDDRVFGNT